MAYTFTRTRTQLATLVLGKLGVLTSGSDVTSAASADGDLVYEAIDLRLKEIHTFGTFWPNVPQRSLSFNVTALSASASVDMLFPISMTIVDSSLDEPVDIITRIQYAAISNKAQTGVPTKAMWAGSAEWLFWPVPSTATTANLVYEQIAEDSSVGGAIDMPVSTLRSFRDLICYDLADHFGKDEAQIARWEREAGRAELRIRKLTAPHTDPQPVQVDDHYGRTARTDSDY